MPSTEYKMERLAPSDVTERSAQLLAGAATDLNLWKKWLTTIAQHPSESANNCASIMASPYEDTRELRSAEGWAEVGGTVDEQARGIPVVRRSKAGIMFTELLYPSSVVEGADPQRFRGLAARVDPEDQIMSRAWDAACAKWNAELSQASDNALFVINARYGLPNDIEPVLPPLAIVNEAREISQFCRSIRNEAEGLIFRLDATYRAQRRNLVAPKVPVESMDVTRGHAESNGVNPHGSSEVVGEGEVVDEGIARTPSSMADTASRIVNAAGREQDGNNPTIGSAMQP